MLGGGYGERPTASNKERALGPLDNCYGFAGMEIAIEEGGIDEEPREEKLLRPIRWDSISYAGQQRREPRDRSRGSDLFSPKPLDPATHSLSRLLAEIQDEVGILIEIEDGKVFLGINDDRILP